MCGGVSESVCHPHARQVLDMALVYQCIALFSRKAILGIMCIALSFQGILRADLYQATCSGEV